MFLDIATVCANKPLHSLLGAWENIYAEKPKDLVATHFRKLVESSLITVDPDSNVTIHDLLRDKGREMVVKLPEYKGTRLWDPLSYEEFAAGRLVRWKSGLFGPIFYHVLSLFRQGHRCFESTLTECTALEMVSTGLQVMMFCILFKLFLHFLFQMKYLFSAHAGSNPTTPDTGRQTPISHAFWQILELENEEG